ncbi:TetR/AcrR family transcriptional regulator C-terminal domain-containing protein [Streptomonospora sediminis]
MARAGDDGGAEPRLVWERPEPPGRPALSPLSRDRIVRAAIELADADGLAAVSLRKVAAALDAGPMRLYGYIATKEELLELMVDSVYGEIVGEAAEGRRDGSDAAGGNWQAVLRSGARGLRRAAHRHPWFVELLGGRPHIGPNALDRQEAELAALDGTPGFEDIDTVLKAVAAVNSYTIGAVRREIADLRAEQATGMDRRQMQQTAGPYMLRVAASGRYPTVARVIRDARHDGADTVFEEGLGYVLDGIAAHAAG